MSTDAAPRGHPVPAERFDPRQYVREELAARGWGIDQLPAPLWDWWTDPAAPLTDCLAVDLAALFGTSAELWLEMERAWTEGR